MLVPVVDWNTVPAELVPPVDASALTGASSPQTEEGPGGASIARGSAPETGLEAEAVPEGTGLAGWGGMLPDNGLVVEVLEAAELLPVRCLPRTGGMLRLRGLFCASNWPLEASKVYVWLEPPS